MTLDKVLFIRMDATDFEAMVLLAAKLGVPVSAAARTLLAAQLRGAVGSMGAGIYVPDPDTQEGAAELDQVADSSDSEA
jgi:hypothetical protein